MQYSPKLKRVMQEIKDILSREDLAGVVVLHEPGSSEFLCKLDPTYSAVKVRGDRIEFKCKAVDFGGDRNKQKKVIEDTINMLDHLCENTGRVVLPLMDLADNVKEKIQVNRTGIGFSDHTTQNN